MDNNDPNFVFGKKWENEVEKLLKKWNYKTEKYITLNDEGEEVAQIWVHENKKYAHPDFTVQKVEEKMYVEVKSYHQFYKNKGLVAENIIYCGEKYLYIKKYNFDSYLKLQEVTGLNVRVIFIVYYDNGFDVDSIFEKWFWKDISELNDRKELVYKPFNKKEKCEDDYYFYFWNYKDLKEIKNISR